MPYCTFRFGTESSIKKGWKKDKKLYETEKSKKRVHEEISVLVIPKIRLVNGEGEVVKLLE
jgi:hypothetical protein